MRWNGHISEKEILICSDSVAALISMKTGVTKSHLDILYEVLLVNSRLVRQGKNYTFLWLPAHSGIQGNEKADKVAKEAVKKEIRGERCGEV